MITLLPQYELEDFNFFRTSLTKEGLDFTYQESSLSSPYKLGQGQFRVNFDTFEEGTSFLKVFKACIYELRKQTCYLKDIRLFDFPTVGFQYTHFRGEFDDFQNMFSTLWYFHYGVCSLSIHKSNDKVAFIRGPQPKVNCYGEIIKGRDPAEQPTIVKEYKILHMCPMTICDHDEANRVLYLKPTTIQ